MCSSPHWQVGLSWFREKLSPANREQRLSRWADFAKNCLPWIGSKELPRFREKYRALGRQKMGSNMRPRYIQFRDIRDRDISGLHCIGYPFKTHLKFKSYEIPFLHKTHFSSPIIRKFANFSQFLNDWVTIISYGQTNFGFKKSFRQISYNAQLPWALPFKACNTNRARPWTEAEVRIVFLLFCCAVMILRIHGMWHHDQILYLSPGDKFPLQSSWSYLPKTGNAVWWGLVCGVPVHGIEEIFGSLTTDGHHPWIWTEQQGQRITHYGQNNRGRG